MKTAQMTSKEFTEDHVGPHIVNVTLADSFGSQFSFNVTFNVVGTETQNKFGLSEPLAYGFTFS